MTKNEALLLESISNRLEQIHDALYGNGDPAHSMMASQVRQETALEETRKASVEAADKIRLLSDKVECVVVNVDKHVKSFHLHSILGNWKFYPTALAVYLVIHNLANVIGRPVLAWLLAFLKVPIPGWLT